VRCGNSLGGVTRERAGTTDVAARAEALRESGVVGVAITFVDNSGITRVKSVPIDRLVAAARDGVGASPSFDAFLFDDSMAMGSPLATPDGDLRLVLDPARLVALHASPGWAWAPADRIGLDGEPYAVDQRGFAREMTERLAAAGLRALVGIEIEFALGRLDALPDFVPATSGAGYGMDRLIDTAAFCRDLLVALAAQGIVVEQLHPEYASGQFEVSVAAAGPVEAADTSVLVRQTIRAVARSHGMAASFAPSVVAGTVGNGGHVHLSVWRGEQNLFAGGPGPAGLTAEAEGFAAGVLRELPALTAIGSPGVASHLRLRPSHWAGAYQAWGVEAREAAIRFIAGLAGTESGSANMEVKSFDLAANPYLAIGALIAAGLGGIETDARLPEPIVGDPAGGSTARRLPESVDAAVDALVASDVLRQAFGAPRFEAFVALRRAEAALLRDADDDEIVARTRWVY